MVTELLVCCLVVALLPGPDTSLTLSYYLDMVEIMTFTSLPYTEQLLCLFTIKLNDKLEKLFCHILRVLTSNKLFYFSFLSTTFVD
jgi:hypothetical protein